VVLALPLKGAAMQLQNHAIHSASDAERDPTPEEIAE
jgi:hypothetical protein